MSWMPSVDFTSAGISGCWSSMEGAQGSMTCRLGVGSNGKMERKSQAEDHGEASGDHAKMQSKKKQQEHPPTHTHNTHPPARTQCQHNKKDCSQ